MREDVHQIPGVGTALISKDGKFRSRSYRAVWWSSLIVALMMLLLALLNFMRWAAPEPGVAKPAPSVNEALYTSPNLNLLDVALAGFVGAKDWSSQLDYIRYPSLIERKILTLFDSHPFRWGHDYRLIKADLEIINEIPQVRALIEMEGSKEQRAVMVEVTENGDYLVDWEYAKMWQEVPWDDFRLRADSTPADMLVAIEPGNYYNFTYQDAKIYQC